MLAMQALMCTRFGPPELLELHERPIPVPGPGQVGIRVVAAGLNFPDVLIIQNKYQFKPSLPFTPGSELAGVVTGVGDGVSDLAPGDSVMAFLVHGAFAEHVVVDAALVVRTPDGMDAVSAAALLLTYGTMDHALSDRGRLAAGETVLVLGASGGIGIASIQMAKAIGARVIACASNDAKLAVCRAEGADEVINYTSEDLRERVKALTDGRGVDVVCDAVGGPFTEPAVRALAWRGRLLVVGFAAGGIPRIPLNLVLLKGAAIVGVFWGDWVRREPANFRASVARLGDWWRAGRIRPHVSATFPLARGADALTLMAARQVVGKVVLTM